MTHTNKETHENHHEILGCCPGGSPGSRPGGGGGHFHIDGDGDVPLDGQGMILRSSPLTCTGYLNRPNWLLADYSVYHRVASQPTMFMTGPRFPPQRRCVRDATAFYECLMIHSRIESPSVPVQGMHMKVFSKVYRDRVYFLCAERFETGSGFHPPPPTARGVQLRGECPPPPGAGVNCPWTPPVKARSLREYG